MPGLINEGVPRRKRGRPLSRPTPKRFLAVVWSVVLVMTDGQDPRFGVIDEDAPTRSDLRGS